MSAVHSDLAFVASPGANRCGCGCGYNNSPAVFRSVWDRLCQQLFGAIPPGMDSETQLPDINVWTEGVVLVDGTNPYTFTVVTDGTESPKPSDVVLYKGKYYVIGEVE